MARQENGKNITVVPSNISSILTPRVLAYWIGGDGTFEKSGGVTILCTDSFTVNEVELLRSISLDKFNIDSTLVSRGAGLEQYRIRIAKESMPTLQKLLSPHIPSTMLYRIGL